MASPSGERGWEVQSPVLDSYVPSKSQGSFASKGEVDIGDNSGRDPICLDVVPTPTGLRKDACSRAHWLSHLKYITLLFPDQLYPESDPSHHLYCHHLALNHGQLSTANT